MTLLPILTSFMKSKSLDSVELQQSSFKAVPTAPGCRLRCDSSVGCATLCIRPTAPDCLVLWQARSVGAAHAASQRIEAAYGGVPGAEVCNAVQPASGSRLLTAVPLQFKI